MALTPKQAERRLEALLKQKSEINQPGHLLAHLAYRLGYPGTEGREVVAEALIRMSGKGLVTLEKTGHTINSVRYTPPAVETRQREDPEVEEEGIDEAPVVAQPTEVPLSQAAEQAVPASAEPLKLSHLDTLGQINGGLRVLRDMADASGHAAGLGPRKVLLELTDLSPSRAGYVCDALVRLEFYTSKMTGFQTYSYWLDLSKGTFTQQHLETFRRLKVTAKQAASTDLEPTDGVANAPLPEPAGAVDDSSPIEQMAEVIESLELALSQQAQQFAETVTERDALRARVSELEAEVATKTESLRAQVEQLQAEIAEMRSTQQAASARAQEILARYQPKQ